MCCSICLLTFRARSNTVKSAFLRVRVKLSPEEKHSNLTSLIGLVVGVASTTSQSRRRTNTAHNCTRNMYRKRHSPDAYQFQKARGHEALQTCPLVQHQLTSSKSTVDETHTSRSCAVGTSRRFPAIEMRESPQMSELTEPGGLTRACRSRATSDRRERHSARCTWIRCLEVTPRVDEEYL